MASRWRLGMIGLTALVGLGLQACIAVPVQTRHNARPAYGYGGSGYSEVNPREAREQCVRAARDYRHYRGVRAGVVDVTGPETAQVELHARVPYRGYTSFGCTYNARTGEAYVR